MQMTRISKWMMISGTLLIWAIKFLVRPFVHIPNELKPLVGFAPNLIGSFLLPFGVCWLLQKYVKMQTIAELNFFCGLGLLLVVINEYIQLIPVFGRTFDYLDIASSVIGVMLGRYVFLRCMIPATFVSKGDQTQTLNSSTF